MVQEAARFYLARRGQSTCEFIYLWHILFYGFSAVVDFEEQLSPHEAEETALDPTDLFAAMFWEAVNLPDSVRVVSGRALPAFEEIAAVSRQALDALSPSLPFEVLYPDLYRSDEARRAINRVALDTSLSRQFDVRQSIDELAQTRSAKLRHVALDLVAQSDDVPSMAFAESPYVPMGQAKLSCELASFLMIYGAATGHDLGVAEVRQGVKALDPMHRVESAVDKASVMTLLKLFATSSFQKTFPDTSCRPIVFAGYTVEDLATLVTRIHERRPAVEIRAVLSVLTEKETDMADGAVHNIVPLTITPKEIIAHDPADYGHQHRSFETKALLQRWYEAQGFGYLVITERHDR